MKESFTKAVITLAWLVLGTHSLFAQNQFPSQIWHQGRIYGLDGQIYEGLVKYDLENNWVQLKTETISTFPASNVSHFEIQKETTDGQRSFYSLPYSPTGEMGTPVFFEVLTEGHAIALLCREYIETTYRDTGTKGVVGMMPSNGPKTIRNKRVAFNYYFFKDNDIQKYSLKKKDLFGFLPDHQNDISHFMRKNNLRHDQRADLLQITSYYNELNKN